MSAIPPDDSPPSASPSDWVASIKQIVLSLLSSIGRARVIFAKISASYSSGNPALLIVPETTTTTGTKTHRVVRPYQRKGSAPAASDSVLVVEDEDGNRVVVGVVEDVATNQTVDADTWLTMSPRIPGTATTHATANTEENTTSATYVKLKEFQLYFPGRYRFTFGLARTGGTTQAILRRRQPDGNYQDVSTAASSGGIYPTFNSNTADMTVSVGWAEWVSVWVLNTFGPAQTGYINDCVVKSSPATSAVTANDLVILD